ncbi:MAG: hypothetical protein K9J81_09470 [Desulfohalobiaceae bacterium]|nr:hypothetical protein [Desulfohalobiaceae bacterium]
MKLHSWQSLLVFAAVLIVWGVPVALQAGEQIVHVTEPVQPAGRVDGSADAAGLGQARSRAVFQEAVGLLPGRLSEARADILASFLSSRARDYVLGDAQGKTETRGDVITTTWRIAVNEAMLKQTLKDWGMYFTFEGTWGYVLKLQADHPEQVQATLQELEALSGLARQKGPYPVLRLLERTGQSAAWRGLLEFEDHSWSAVGSSVEDVWFECWSNYFRLPEIQARVITEKILNVQGFSSVTGVRGFDRILQGQAAFINEARLLRIGLLTGCVEAVWKVRTPDSQRLGRYLNDYLAPRGLRHDFPGDREP